MFPSYPYCWFRVGAQEIVRSARVRHAESSWDVEGSARNTRGQQCGWICGGEDGGGEDGGSRAGVCVSWDGGRSGKSTP